MRGPLPMPDPYRHRLRIYWEDTDAGGVVFYANYLKFFERARTEWLRHLGHGQEALRRDHDTIFVVTDTALRYLRPARLDDLIDVTVKVQRSGGASLTIAQQAWRDDAGVATLLAEGTIRIGCVSAGTFAPRRIPTDLLTATR
ncbi:MAG: tol-pal system-associated acyl-CoA thioesterase [Burkholderiaceae bacterium]